MGINLDLLAFILMIEYVSVDGLKCLKCNTVQHGSLCGPDATFLRVNSSMIEECHVTCRVSKIKAPNGKEVFLRGCSNTRKTGCVSRNFTSSGDKRLPGHLCQCNRDLCNADFNFGSKNHPLVKEPLRVPLSDQTSIETTSLGTTVSTPFSSMILFFIANLME
ncbi:uncharacterized protein LOC133184947 [Saccostrea echinata]|uniref:uncharacterized protein LOC133176923 n=1 Tax=Saccostrea echinata TaxID=191078 RepID=UPI002A7F397C|nr:uncharacterized protein LOC133176923 [Saccostrea echinata]XP_061176000.1 uncharacterized protein LOC133184947 [Saccostrea echinata]